MSLVSNFVFQTVLGWKIKVSLKWNNQRIVEANFSFSVLNLYPIDAGTDSGPSYISPKQPTIPRDAIRRIKTNYPNDVRSPFYDTTGNEMKPMARLYLNRQRIYEKVCEGGSQEDTEDNACEVSPWGNFDKI